MKLRLTFKRGIIRRPVLAETILETGTMIDIELARVDGSAGELVISIPDENCRSIVDTLRKKNVEVTRLGETIVKDEENCIHCGACVSICPVNAIRYEHNWQVTIDKSTCVQCGTCVPACPVGVISLPKKT